MNCCKILLRRFQKSSVQLFKSEMLGQSMRNVLINIIENQNLTIFSLIHSNLKYCTSRLIKFPRFISAIKKLKSKKNPLKN